MSRTFEERMAQEDAYDRGYEAGYYAGIREGYAEAINDTPPVKHGQWVTKGQEIYCSECGAESSYNAFGASQFTHFCPNCGADMKEGMKKNECKS